MSVKMVGFLAKFTYNLDYERSLFFLGLSSGTCETRKWPRAWLQARDGRGFAARRSRAPALSSLNLKENRDCSQSTYYQAIQTFPFIVFRLKNSKKPQDAKETSIRICFKLIHPKKGVNTWRRHFFFNLELWRVQLHKKLELESMWSLFSCLQLLRDAFIFKIVPMLNPDGVIVGNYRCSLAGRDLNRNYKTVLKDSFPPIWHVKSMVRK